MLQNYTDLKYLTPSLTTYHFEFVGQEELQQQAHRQQPCIYRRDQNQIAGLAREYDYMGRSLMFFWSHVDVMENSKMLPSNRITHFSGPDHQPLPLAMPWYSSSSSYAPMAAAASGLVVVVVLVEEALVEEMQNQKEQAISWKVKAKRGEFLWKIEKSTTYVHII